MTAGLYRKFGIRYWSAIPVKLKPFVDQHFEVRFYGVGFWMLPIIPGVLVWKRRHTPPPAGETLGGGER